MDPRRIPFLVALLALPVAASAHHGWSGYDEAKPITVNAVLSDVAFENPHGSAKVLRNKESWVVVLAPVARMEARGLTKAMLTDGKPVTLVGYQRSDGTKEMRIERVTAGGKTVELR